MAEISHYRGSMGVFDRLKLIKTVLELIYHCMKKTQEMRHRGDTVSCPFLSVKRIGSRLELL